MIVDKIVKYILTIDGVINRECIYPLVIIDSRSIQFGFSLIDLKKKYPSSVDYF